MQNLTQNPTQTYQIPISQKINRDGSPKNHAPQKNKNNETSSVDSDTVEIFTQFCCNLYNNFHCTHNCVECCNCHNCDCDCDDND